MNLDKREQAKELLRAAAFPAKRECPHCGGTGEVNDNSRWIIHVRGSLSGASWPLDSALEAVDQADAIAWQPDVFGHELKVCVGGKTWSFDAKRPTVGAST